MLPEDPLVRAALVVGSDELFAAAERSHACDSASVRVRRKVLRYLIRMSTRPTPYGLFAGVGLVEWSAATDAALGPGPPRTRARPDMGWLFGLVSELEGDAHVRPGLRYFTNPLAFLRANRFFVAEREAGSDGDESRSGVSVRATPAVRRTLELARTPTPYPSIVRELMGLEGATRAAVEALLDDLMRHGMLLSDLRPPLTHPSPARYVRDRLRRVPAATPTGDALQALLDRLEAWDHLPLDERAEGWARLSEHAERVRPDAPPGAVVQVDAALPLSERRVHAAVADEAARAAELLVALSPPPFGVTHLDAYKGRFQERYGEQREVPLLELLDPEFGLGPPPEDEVSEPVTSARGQALIDIASEALHDRLRVVELDDEILDRLAPGARVQAMPRRAFEVSLLVAARSAAAIDAGDFLLIVSPNSGAETAGQTMGRFADLLGEEARAAMARVAADEENGDCRLHAELVYLPWHRRSANVAVRPLVVSHEIVCGTMAGGRADNVIPPDQLMVGLRDERWYVRWRERDAEIIASERHMLNRRHAPAALRFLADISRAERGMPPPFDWGPAAGFPVLPRIQSGRVVVAPGRWRISLGALSAGTDEALARWRARWSVPRHVYLADRDKRLLLDLYSASHRTVLLDELADTAVTLEEALPGLNDAWLQGAQGRHLVELIVPVRSRAARSGATRPAAHPRARQEPQVRPHVTPAIRLRLPGSDWLFLKLYCAPSIADELIGDEIGPFADAVRSAALAEEWFFTRYRDPEPHLRIRFRGHPERLTSALLPQVASWARSLVAEDLCSRFAFDTYEREVERYGGDAATDVAELIFGADSRAVAQLLRVAGDDAAVDRTNIAVATVDGLLDGLGFDIVERLRWYAQRVALSPADGRDYRSRRAQLFELVDVAERAPGEQKVTASIERVLAERRRALLGVSVRLEALTCTEAMSRTRAAFAAAQVHMHCNRLLGTERAIETRVLQLARRTVAAVAHRAQISTQWP
jgi:thiopeptide-type bacteriocin biosynthesis protein